MSKSVGDQIEQQALAFLLQQGATLVTRNYRSRGGEIDLIVEHGQTLIFAEVRYRDSARFGSAAESVDRRKQQRIMRTAEHYLQAHPKLQNRACRFDVLACRPPQERIQIDWIINAFEP